MWANRTKTSRAMRGAEGESTAMWTSETFASLDQLIGYLNEHRIRSERCKIVVVETGHGGSGFHLLIQAESDPDPQLLAVAQAETSPLPTPERGQVVDEADAIISDAQRDE
jgi:hypothetical protein